MAVAFVQNLQVALALLFLVCFALKFEVLNTIFCSELGLYNSNSQASLKEGISFEVL